MKTKTKLFQVSLADASVHEFPRHLRDHLVMEAVTIARFSPVPFFHIKIHTCCQKPKSGIAIVQPISRPLNEYHAMC